MAARNETVAPEMSVRNRVSAPEGPVSGENEGFNIDEYLNKRDQKV